MRRWLMVSKTARQCHLCGNPTPSIIYGRASFVVKFYELLIAAVNYCENKDQEQKGRWKSPECHTWSLAAPDTVAPVDAQFPLGSLRPQTCRTTSPAAVLWNCKWWGQPTSTLLVVAASTEHAMCNGWAVLQMAVARVQVLQPAGRSRCWTSGCRTTGENLIYQKQSVQGLTPVVGGDGNTYWIYHAHLTVPSKHQKGAA